MQQQSASGKRLALHPSPSNSKPRDKHIRLIEVGDSDRQNDRRNERGQRKRHSNTDTRAHRLDDQLFGQISDEIIIIGTRPQIGVWLIPTASLYQLHLRNFFHPGDTYLRLVPSSHDGQCGFTALSAPAARLECRWSRFPFPVGPGLWRFQLTTADPDINNSFWATRKQTAITEFN